MKIGKHVRSFSSRLPANGPELKDFIQNSETSAAVTRSTSSSSQMSIPTTYPMTDKSTAVLRPKKKTFFIETYGCQMNSSDSEIVRSILLQHAYEESPTFESADVLLLNTCAIRENAETRIWSRLREFRGLKRQFQGSLPPRRNKLKKYPHLQANVEQLNYFNPVVGLLGCMAERLKLKLLDPAEKLVDVVVGPDAYRDLPHLLDVVCQGNKDENDTSSHMNVQLSLEETYADITPVRSNPNAPSAYVSIMRGCNNMCSYCIVPFTRGRERSQPLPTVIDHVRRLRDQGVKEIVLLGQNVNSYHDTRDQESGGGRGYHSAQGFTNLFRSRDQLGYRFADVLDQVAQVDAEVRVRFTSPHPKDFPDDVLSVVAHHANICKAIHMPAQSGNSAVLRRMRRGYSREAYLDLVSNIRTKIPGVALSSDFITGFCGESEAEHRDTLSLMEQVVFDQAFMFAYSLRDRTHAAHRLEDNIPEATKQRRLGEIIQVFHDGISHKNQTEEVGRHHLVLVEGPSKRSKAGSREWTGLTDTGKRCTFAQTNVRPSIVSGLSSNVALRVGDYALVEITEARRHTLRAQARARTTIVEMKAFDIASDFQFLNDDSSLLRAHY